jgi:hemerythrin-like domain-containing protein
MNGSREQLAPTEALRSEHTVILLVVDAMERQVAAIRSGEGFDAGAVEKMLQFTREFSDGSHHAKEEKVLFPTLQEASPMANGPVSVMLHEHDQGRAFVRAVAAALPAAAAGDDAARTTVADNLAGYAALLRAHIDKEDEVLFPFAERTLSADDTARLAGEFARIEEEETGAGVHEKYDAMAHEIAEREKRGGRGGKGVKRPAGK